MYRKKHGLGVRRASSLTGSYHESNVAVLCQDNFFGGFKYNLTYGSQNIKKKNKDVVDHKSLISTESSTAKNPSRKSSSKTKLSKLGAKLKHSIRAKTRLSGDKEVMMKNLQCQRVKRRVSLDAGAITSVLLGLDQPVKKKPKIDCGFKSSNSESVNSQQNKNDTVLNKKANLSKLVTKSSKLSQSLPNQSLPKSVSQSSKVSPQKAQTSKTSQKPLKMSTPIKSSSPTKSSTQKSTPSHPASRSYQKRNTSPKSNTKSSLVDVACSPITPSLLFPCVEVKDINRGMNKNKITRVEKTKNKTEILFDTKNKKREEIEKLEKKASAKKCHNASQPKEGGSKRKLMPPQPSTARKRLFQGLEVKESFPSKMTSPKAAKAISSKSINKSVKKTHHTVGKGARRKDDEFKKAGVEGGAEKDRQRSDKEVKKKRGRKKVVVSVVDSRPGKRIASLNAKVGACVVLLYISSLNS